MPEPLVLELVDPDLGSTQAAAAPRAEGAPILPEYGEITIPVATVLRDMRFDFYADAVKKGLFDVRLRGHEVVIKAGHFLGRIAVNDRLEIEVVARVPAANLGRILRVSGHIPFESERLTREYGLSDDPHPPVLDIFVHALIRALRPLQTEGIYRRYERRTEASSFPRGRFLLGETVTKQMARGQPNRATTSVFEHSKDNGPNRVIKLALWHAAALIASRAQRKGAQRLLDDLNAAYSLFDGVRLDLSLACLADREVGDPSLLPTTRAYYEPAVRLSRAIVERKSVEYDRIGNELVLPALLIDLQSAFEDYLLAVLRARLTRVHPGLAVVSGNLFEPIGGGKALFDNGSKVPAQPDIVFRIGTGDGRFQLVGEVKYIDRDFSRDHINQALAYAVSYRTPVVLIRPKLGGEVAGLTVLGVVADVTAYRYLIDLNADLGEAEGLFAAAMRSLLTLTSEAAA